MSISPPLLLSLLPTTISSHRPLLDTSPPHQKPGEGCEEKRKKRFFPLLPGAHIRTYPVIGGYSSPPIRPGGRSVRPPMISFFPFFLLLERPPLPPLVCHCQLPPSFLPPPATTVLFSRNCSLAETDITLHFDVRAFASCDM